MFVDSAKLARQLEEPFASATAHIPAGDASRCPHAEVTINLTAPFPSWRWLKLQLLNANWATLALMIAVIGVSSNINHQVDDMRAQSLASQLQYNQLKGLLDQAGTAASQLSQMNAQLVAYNATLNHALDLGFANITGTLQSLSHQLAPARLYAIGPTQSQPAKGRTMLPFPNVVLNSSGMASSTDHTLFVCQQAGYYRIQAQVTMAGTNAYTQWTVLAVMLKGAVIAETGSMGAIGVQVSIERALEVGDELQIQMDSSAECYDQPAWLLINRLPSLD